MPPIGGILLGIVGMRPSPWHNLLKISALPSRQHALEYAIAVNQQVL
jgi:hypothetical protein